MSCYPGKASKKRAHNCTTCNAGTLCPEGTPLKAPTQQTTGTLALGGVTKEQFEDEYEKLLNETLNHFEATFGFRPTNLVLSIASAPTPAPSFPWSIPSRQLASGLLLQYTLDIEIDSEQPAISSEDAANAMMTALETPGVAAALGVVASSITVNSTSAPQQTTVLPIVEHCPAGKYSSAGAGECTDCAPGKYATKGMEICTPCAPGTFAANGGTAECSECPISYYQSDHQQTICTECMEFSSTNRSAATDVTECKCMPLYYQDCPVDSVCQCLECPDNADCDQIGLMLGTLPPKSGFWRAINTTTVFHKCTKPEACSGVPFNESRTIPRDAQCIRGYGGLMCTECDAVSGYIRRFADSCATCTGDEAASIGSALLFFFLFVVVILLCAWFKFRKQVLDGKATLKELLKLFQAAFRRRTVR
jgi:hypothetical protein